MVEINHKALNEKLLKFCGFNYKPLYKNSDLNVWWLPDGEPPADLKTPNLVKNLNAQFKYIWPKLKEEGWMIRYQYSQLRDNDTGKLISDWTYTCWVYDVSHKRGLNNFEYWVTNKENPAIACALAVEKLIDSMDGKNESRNPKN